MDISMRSFYKTFHSKFIKIYPSKDTCSKYSKAVFTTLAEMALDRNMQCWVTGSRICNKELKARLERKNGSELSEYMVDMCWASNRKISLAIESEWDTNLDSLSWDFAKLIDINSSRKVFISDFGKNKQKKEKKIKALCELIGAYDQKRLFEDDQYLFIDINPKNIAYACYAINKSKKLTLRFEKEQSWDSETK